MPPGPVCRPAWRSCAEDAAGAELLDPEAVPLVAGAAEPFPRGGAGAGWASASATADGVDGALGVLREASPPLDAVAVTTTTDETTAPISASFGRRRTKASASLRPRDTRPPTERAECETRSRGGATTLGAGAVIPSMHCCRIGKSSPAFA